MNEEELYAGYDEDTVNEIEGITDKVTDLSYTKLEYPAILFKEDFQLPKHKIILISNMVKSASSGKKKDISLYHANKGDIYKLGTISGYQVNHLLNIIPKDSAIGFYDDGSILEGEKMYVLCSFY